MPYLDLILVLPIAWGMFRGFKRGFIIELCTLMALILGVYGAAAFGDIAADYLVKTFHTDEQLSMVLAFALLFVGIVIAVYFFGKVLESVIKLVALGLVNKLFGMAFGGAKFALIISALLYVWNGFPFTDQVIPGQWKQSSYLYTPVCSLAPALYPVLQDQDWLHKLEKQLEEWVGEPKTNQSPGARCTETAGSCTHELEGNQNKYTNLMQI